MPFFGLLEDLLEQKDVGVGRVDELRLDLRANLVRDVAQDVLHLLQGERAVQQPGVKKRLFSIQVYLVVCVRYGLINWSYNEFAYKRLIDWFSTFFWVEMKYLNNLVTHWKETTRLRIKGLID